MDLFEEQWIVLRWPVGLLTDAERECLEEYLDYDFQIGTVRFEAGAPGSAVEIIGSAQGVVRRVVLEFIEKFVAEPTTKIPQLFPETDEEGG